MAHHLYSMSEGERLSVGCAGAGSTKWDLAHSRTNISTLSGHYVHAPTSSPSLDIMFTCTNTHRIALGIGMCVALAVNGRACIGAGNGACCLGLGVSVDPRLEGWSL